VQIDVINPTTDRVSTAVLRSHTLSRASIHERRTTIPQSVHGARAAARRDGEFTAGPISRWRSTSTCGNYTGERALHIAAGALQPFILSRIRTQLVRVTDARSTVSFWETARHAGCGGPGSSTTSCLILCTSGEVWSSFPYGRGRGSMWGFG